MLSLSHGCPGKFSDVHVNAQELFA